MLAAPTTLGSSRVEETDRMIVRLLAADGRMSFTDLGKATGLSTSAVHQRVKRLEKRGADRGYGATVNHDELGLPLTAFVSITADRPQPARRLPRAPPRDPGDRVVLVGGRGRVLHPQGPGGDPHALEDLLARIRSGANVSTRTTIVLSTPYENRTVTE